MLHKMVKPIDTAYVSAKTVTVDGYAETKDLTVKATDASVNGVWDYTGQLNVDTTNQFSTGLNSQMRGSA